MYLVKPLSRDKGSGRSTMYLPFRPTDSLGRKGQIHCGSARPLVPREGLYQIHGQSLNTHRGKHRSGGAQTHTRAHMRTVTGKSLDIQESWQKIMPNKCPKHIQKLSKNCPNPQQRRQIFITFLDFGIFGLCFYLVTLSTACPLQHAHLLLFRERCMHISSLSYAACMELKSKIFIGVRGGGNCFTLLYCVHTLYIYIYISSNVCPEASRLWGMHPLCAWATTSDRWLSRYTLKDKWRPRELPSFAMWLLICWFFHITTPFEVDCYDNT